MKLHTELGRLWLKWKDVKEHACLDDDSIFGHFRTNGEFGNVRCAPEFDVEAIYGHMRKYAEYGKFRS